MKIILKTAVDGNFKDIFKKFDQNLFIYLNPRFIKIKRFDGVNVGDEFEISFPFNWRGKIVEHVEGENENFFVDVGVQLPFKIKQWKHKHIVKKLAVNKSEIIDDLEFEGNILLYPFMYIMLLMRKPLYRNFFLINILLVSAMTNAKDLKKVLTPMQYSCTQEEGTEPPFKNAYWNFHEDGIYVDVVSGEPLFSSLDKFDSGTGWPSFTKPIDGDAIQTKIDHKIGVARTELRSTKANSHLGHVFDDGPGPLHKRYCINSASLRFIPLDQLKVNGFGRFLFDFVAKKNWEVAVVAGGCFWGMQELYRTQKGVIYSEVGYTGGSVPNVKYSDVKTGKSGHAEAVRIIFNPKETSYQEILLYFFKIHDPTTKDRQGNDVGAQYRSEIFAMNSLQEKTANEVILRVNKSKKWPAPVATKIGAFTNFWRGEEEHQEYLVKHPGGYTCHFPRKIDF